MKKLHVAEFAIANITLLSLIGITDYVFSTKRISFNMSKFIVSSLLLSVASAFVPASIRQTGRSVALRAADDQVNGGNVAIIF